MPPKKTTVVVTAPALSEVNGDRILASLGITNEDEPAQARHPASTPAWAGLPSASQPTAMGDAALRAMGVTSDPPLAGPGPFAMLGSGPNVPNISIEGIDHVSLVPNQETGIALSAPPPRRMDDDRPSRGPLGIDPLTLRLGSTYYLSDKVFDSMKDARGWRLHFTRWYPDLRVLVDFYRKPSSEASADVEQKIRHLRAHNELSPDAKIGFVPLFVGDVPDDNTLLAACAGHVFDLPLRSPVGRFL